MSIWKLEWALDMHGSGFGSLTEYGSAWPPNGSRKDASTCSCVRACAFVCVDMFARDVHPAASTPTKASAKLRGLHTGPGADPRASCEASNSSVGQWWHGAHL
jgi:hypothetical protein